MYKHVKTLLLSAVMLFSVCLQGVTAYAAESGMAFTIERNKETAEAGDTVNYKIYVDEIARVMNFKVSLVIPEGLTLVEAPNKIWKPVGDFTYMPNPDEPILVGNTTDFANGTTVAGQHLLAEFSCTVGEGATDLEVTFKYGPEDTAVVDADLNSTEPIPEQVVKAGYTVSGTVTSYINDTDEITVELYQDGVEEAAFTTTVTGKSATYTIEEVPDGEYTMKVAKEDHVTREYSVKVEGAEVVQDVQINPVGDSNFDGIVNGIDLAMVNRHFAEITALEGYNFQCADVNADGIVNGIDLAMVNRHFAEIVPLW